MLDNHLATRAFFVGERITLADIFVAAYVQHVVSVTIDPPARTNYPRLMRHLKNIVNRTKLVDVVSGEAPPYAWEAEEEEAAVVVETEAAGEAAGEAAEEVDSLVCFLSMLRLDPPSFMVVELIVFIINKLSGRPKTKHKPDDTTPFPGCLMDCADRVLSVGMNIHLRLCIFLVVVSNRER
jgi:hypothetical protein